MGTINVYAAAPNTATNPTPNEIIVIYKAQQSPDELFQAIRKRQEERKNIFGALKIYFGDVLGIINKKTSPEFRLRELLAMNEKVGVSSKKLLYKDTATGKTTYLLKISPNINIMSAVKMYATLPEVQSAQPNYTLHMSL
ncbi:MAG: hypothetical protein Q7S38_00655 [bacterium]|nr:hypothetical protein [bacterium]